MSKSKMSIETVGSPGDRTMTFRAVKIGLAVCSGLLVLGCEGSTFSLNLHPGYHTDHHPVLLSYAQVDHVCGRHCDDHYWTGSRVVVLNDHNHHAGCGHDWDGSHWIAVSRRHRRPAVHVCGHGCNHHYWNGHELVGLTGHVHGHRCGHSWSGKRWIVELAAQIVTEHHGHTCTRACDHHFWDGARLVILTGHRHFRGCGHKWSGHRWVSTGKIKANRGHHKQEKKHHKSGKRIRRGP